ncbi:MAG: hypothetical protein AAF558_00950 [Verrucomicrobiota bacterium]
MVSKLPSFWIVYLVFFGFPLLLLGKTEPLQTAFRHEATKILFPRQIDAFVLESKTTYSPAEKLGISLQYVEPEKAKVDIFIYTKGLDQVARDPENSLAFAELAAMQRGVQQIEVRGFYSDTLISQQVKAHNVGTGLVEEPVVFLSSSAAFRQILTPDEKPIPDSQLQYSWGAVAIFENHFVKIRYITQEDGRETMFTAFLNRFGFLLLEPQLQGKVVMWLNTYTSSPLSKQGKLALDNVLGYAESSPLIRIQLPKEYTPWKTRTKYPYSKELLGASIAGQVREQILTQDFSPKPFLGLLQVLSVYPELKADDTKARVSELDEFLMLKTAGKLAETLGIKTE